MGSSSILPPQGQPGPMKPGEFVSAAVPNVVSFGLDLVSPPSTLYIQRDDELLLRVMSLGAAGDTVDFVGRLLQAAPDLPGQPGTPPPAPIAQPGPNKTQTIKNIGQTIVVAQLVNTTKILPLTEGYLLSFSATARNTVSRGNTFASAGILRRGPNGAQVYLPLFADYSTASTPIGWPGGRITQPSESSGAALLVQVTNPGAGVDWAVSVPSFLRWRVRSLAALFTASAAVANRNVTIIIDDGAGHTYWEFDATASITAGQAITIVATGLNAPTGVVTTILSIPIPPDLVLRTVFRIFTSTANIQVADQWSNINLLTEQWIDI